VEEEKTEATASSLATPDIADNTAPKKAQDAPRKICPICDASVPNLVKHIRGVHDVDPRTVIPPPPPLNMNFQVHDVHIRESYGFIRTFFLLNLQYSICFGYKA
jgi:hypothetical protein